MRIELNGVSQTSGIRSTTDKVTLPQRSSQASTDASPDVLLISSGVATSASREVMLDELKQVYRDRGLSREPAVVAERLLVWGFDTLDEARS